MFRTTIDLNAAVTITAQVVREHGRDHAPQTPSGAPGCNYTTVGLRNSDLSIDHTARLVAVCIVGQVFAHLGILRALFRPSGGEWSICEVGASLWDDAATMGVEFTDEARQFLRDCQQRQDSGMVWGDALDKSFREAQERAVQNFREQNPLFGPVAAEVVSATQEPLARWERELLGDSPF